MNELVVDYFVSFCRPKVVENPPFFRFWIPPEERIPVSTQAIPLPYKDQIIPLGGDSQQYTPTLQYSTKFILTRDNGFKRGAPIDDSYVEILPPQKKMKLDINMDCSCQYPFEVWMEISKYIAPEDISSFARICKHSYAVVQSAMFWKQTFDRFYKPSIPLPCFLREAVKNNFGLRANVIRSLFFLYPPFINKLKVTKSPEANLVDMVCFEQSNEFNREMKYGMCTFMFQEKEFIQLFLGKNDEYRLGVSQNKYDGAIALKVTFKDMNQPDKLLLGMAIENVKICDRSGPLCKYALLEAYDPFGIRSVQKVKLLLKDILAVQIHPWWSPCFFHAHPFPAEQQPHFTLCM